MKAYLLECWLYCESLGESCVPFRQRYNCKTKLLKLLFIAEHKIFKTKFDLIRHYIFHCNLFYQDTGNKTNRVFLYSFIIIFVFLQIKHAHTITCLDCCTSYLRSAHVNVLSLSRLPSSDALVHPVHLLNWLLDQKHLSVACMLLVLKWS